MSGRFTVTPERMAKAADYRWQVNATDKRISAYAYTAMAYSKQRNQRAEMRDARAQAIEEVVLREARIQAKEPGFCRDLQRWISECVDERLQAEVAQYWRALGARI